ncbi:MAG TPA: RNA polymerase sigma-70 factor [Puia sp.]|nr:RNA polymerase sigma-70 factor [Puia sp.]
MALKKNLTATRMGSPSPGEPLNRETFELFFKENFLRFCLLCQFKFGFDTEQAKEIVHVSFVKLWESRASIRTGTSLSAYFVTILYNSSLDAIRHEKVKLRYKKAYLNSMDGIPSEAGSSIMDLQQLKSDIAEAIESMPGQMRIIFELSRFGGLKYADIAAKLGLSAKTVENQMGRALRRLREKLSHYLGVCLLFFFLGS